MDDRTTNRRRQLATLDAIADRRARADDGPGLMVGRVFDDGAMPRTVPAFYAVHPVDVGGAEVEGGPGVLTPRKDAALVLVTDQVPVVGDYLVCRRAGARWVAERGCGATSPPPPPPGCPPCNSYWASGQTPPATLTTTWVYTPDFFNFYTFTMGMFCAKVSLCQWVGSATVPNSGGAILQATVTYNGSFWVVSSLPVGCSIAQAAPISNPVYVNCGSSCTNSIYTLKAITS